jgi:hypothetical protein
MATKQDELDLAAERQEYGRLEVVRPDFPAG